MYLNLLKEQKTKNLIKLFSVSFNCFYLLSFTYIGVQKYTILVEFVIVSIYFFTYLRELLNSDQIINYKKQLPFWITTGLLLFFLSFYHDSGSIVPENVSSLSSGMWIKLSLREGLDVCRERNLTFNLIAERRKSKLPSTSLIFTINL